LGKGAYRNCKHNGRRRERTVASGQWSGVRISDLGEGPKLAEVTEREFSPQRHRVHEVRKEEGMVFLFWDVDLLLNGKAMAVRWRAAVPSSCWSLDIWKALSCPLEHHRKGFEPISICSIDYGFISRYITIH
jgi:hypothetical protein